MVTHNSSLSDRNAAVPLYGRALMQVFRQKWRTYHPLCKLVRRSAAMLALPNGTVTFLFTDIEGSTRLWEQHPEAMRLALSHHDALMRAVIAQHDGHVFKTIGDAFCAAFHTAPDALSAVLALQQALISEPRTEPVTIKVRTALHTGAAEVRDNDYFGQPLNRVARLLAAGHGGQVLISAATQELTRDTLPPLVSLRELGEHRLRDLNRPEQVFQLLHDDLPADFPPLKSLDYLPNNLPRQLTSFVGREKESTEVATLLTKTGLLTLTGSGGCGKTRLALQVAAEMLDQYPDGVWLVELAPLTDPTLVPQTIAIVLGLTEQTGKTYLQTLVDYLKSKCLLLMLDNCEHLLTACSQAVNVLLRSCPSVKVLVTSREALGIAGEQTYRVPSLSLPDLKQIASPQSVSQYEAVRLFIERALLVNPDFAVTNQNAPALAQLCCHLDGIPLAVELAAARIRSLPIEDINARLDNRFRLLTGGDRTALPRQQTLRALMDWSYDLLNPQEKLLLRRLSVFAGGWMLEMAETVCIGESVTEERIEGWEVLDLMSSLVDKSLIFVEEQNGVARYHLLETVQQYSTEKLEASGMAEESRQRHQQFFLTLVEETEPQLLAAEQIVWLQKLEDEHDNLRVALQAPNKRNSFRIAVALSWFWETRGYISEGRAALSTLLLEAGVSAEPGERAKALQGVGNLAHLQGDYGAARSLHEESLALQKEVGNKRGMAYSLNLLGNVIFDQGDYGAARSLHEESLALQKEVGNKQGMAQSVHGLGLVAWLQGDYEVAQAKLEESLVMNREIGNWHCFANSLCVLGIVTANQGDYRAARTLLEESLVINTKMESKWGVALSLLTLGEVLYAQNDDRDARPVLEKSLTLFEEFGDLSAIPAALSRLGVVACIQCDYDAARTLFEESLVRFQQLKDKSGVVFSLEGFALLAADQGEAERAAQICGAAVRLREEIGAPLPSMHRERYHRFESNVRQVLGKKTFAAAWANGAAMTLERAIEYALASNPAK